MRERERERERERGGGGGENRETVRQADREGFYKKNFKKERGE